MNEPAERTLKSRLQLVLLALLFAAPFAAALVVSRLAPHWRPAGRTNFGVLIDPPVALPVPAWRNARDGNGVDPNRLYGRFRWVYVGGAGCDARCQNRLHLMHQTWVTLADDRARVQRVYIAPDLAAAVAARASAGSEQADMLFVAEQGPGPGWAVGLAPRLPEAFELVDPFGYWMMRYPPPPRADAASVQRQFKGMQKDLKKLLHNTLEANRPAPGSQPSVLPAAIPTAATPVGPTGTLPFPAPTSRTP